MVSKIKVDEIESSQANGATLLEVPVKKIQTITSSSNTLSINVASGSTGTYTLTEDITDIDFTNVPTSGLFEFTLQVTQHASDAKTINLSAITVNGGTESGGLLKDASSIDMTEALGSKDIYTFIFINAGTPYIKKDSNHKDVAFPVTSGEICRLDAGLTDSYSGTGNTWYDISGNNNDFTLANQSWNSNGYFTLSSTFYFGKTSFANQVGSLYIVIQSNDAQAIYFSDNTSQSNYIAAFKSTNGLYHSNAGTITTYVNNVTSTNLYTDARHASDIHLVTFTGISATNWSNHGLYLDRYTSFEWNEGGKVYAFGAYSDNLTSTEVSSIYTYFNSTRSIVT